MKFLLQQLIERENLTVQQCQQAIDLMMSEAETAEISAFLVLLHAKPVTATELYGLVKAMRAYMIEVNVEGELLDIVGTGGDGAKTVNISTAASILAASCGVKVAKHGNRSVSSSCGSADLLEALGIQIELNAEQVASSIRELGIGFCYAPLFHPAMSKLKSVRNALKIPTTFNVIGPLLNPAKAQHYLLGVANPKNLSMIAETLFKLNVNHALVVHSAGLDEISLIEPTQALEVTAAGVKPLVIDPIDYGFEYGSLSDIQGDNASFNLRHINEVFKGKPSKLADTIIFNAGVGLYVANYVSSIQEGVQLARHNLQNQEGQRLLERWKHFKFK